MFTLQVDLLVFLCKMDDKFVNWEHLDLDDLLGDYTNDGEFCAESEWSDGNNFDENSTDTQPQPNTDNNEKENNVPMKKRRVSDKNKYC